MTDKIQFDGSTAARAIKAGITLSLLQATGADKRLADDKHCEDGLRARGRSKMGSISD